MSIRLTDMEPAWLTTGDGRHGMGVTFNCPHCDGNQSIGVFFANPIDGGPPAPPDVDPSPRWQRTGDTFDTLTITPSIDVSRSGHWHGFVTNGNLT